MQEQESCLGGAAGDAGASNNDIGKAADATNPIAAAIGTNAAEGGGANFGAGMNNSSDKIAAAIVLRGMAKDGKFSLANQDNNDQKAKVKSVVR